MACLIPVLVASLNLRPQTSWEQEVPAVELRAASPVPFFPMTGVEELVATKNGGFVVVQSVSSKTEGSARRVVFFDRNGARLTERKVEFGAELIGADAEGTPILVQASAVVKAIGRDGEEWGPNLPGEEGLEIRGAYSLMSGIATAAVLKEGDVVCVVPNSGALALDESTGRVASISGPLVRSARLTLYDPAGKPGPTLTPRLASGMELIPGLPYGSARFVSPHRVAAIFRTPSVVAAPDGTLHRLLVAVVDVRTGSATLLGGYRTRAVHLIPFTRLRIDVLTDGRIAVADDEGVHVYSQSSTESPRSGSRREIVFPEPIHVGGVPGHSRPEGSQMDVLDALACRVSQFVNGGDFPAHAMLPRGGRR